MALFGIGGSKSSSKSFSEAQSTSFDRAVSGQAARSTQSLAFEDLFRTLFGDSMGAAGKLAAQVPAFQGQAAQLFSGGLSLLEQLSGGPGQEFLAERVSGGNPLLDEQIGALQEDLGRMFREELMPGITSQHVVSGTLGGGRQGVAQGRAMDTVAREFARGATELRAADLAARDAAATQLMQGQLQGAATGLSALPGILGLAETGLSAEMLPQILLSQILGGPVTLTESLSEGFSFSEGASQSTATSKSKGKSAGFNFGFG